MPTTIRTDTDPAGGVVRVGTHATTGDGSVNTHWLETAHGVVVIDTQREIAEAGRALAAIQQTGKPIVAIIATHGHADHVGGIGVFTAAAGPGVPVYASQVSRHTVEQDPYGLRSIARAVLGEDFPPDDTLPQHHPVEDGQVLTLDGVEITVHEFGPGEASSMSLLTVGGTDLIFPGDLVYNGYTPLLLEQRTTAWIAQLETITDRIPGPGLAHPGHGPAGDWTTLLQGQLDYLRTFRSIVHAALDGATELTDEATTDVVQQTRRRFPGHHTVVPVIPQLPDLIAANARAVAAELTDTGAGPEDTAAR